MKLADILFTQGFGIRYDCNRLIEAGMVSIGGQTVDDPFFEADVAELTFAVGGVEWPYREKAIIALNKPAGYECSLKPSAHPSVMTLIPAPLRKRNVQPVGRLDVDTTGLLLLTDDGALLHRLIHPKRHVEKSYIATLKHPVTEKMLSMLRQGVTLADDPIPVAARTAEALGERTLELVLTQGKYHQVKRMVAACSNRVEALHRNRFGKLVLPDTLPEGEWIWVKQEDIL